MSRPRLLFLAVLLAVPIIGSAADTHYAFDRTGGKSAGYRLGRAHESLDNAMQYLEAERATMIAMIDGDSANDASYTAVKDAYGFASNADAHAAFSELDSLWAKLSGDGSVSGVNAAILQFLARLRS